MVVNRILVDFAGWTSAHGIPHIGSAQNNCLRVFWTVIFVASTSMFIFQMVLLIQKYTSYDVTVQTELKFEEREFPAVTMCNLNPYRKAQLHLSKDMKSLMENYEAAIQGSNSHLDLTNEWKFRQLNDTIAIQSAARDHLLFIAGNMSRNIRDQMTYNLRDDQTFMTGFVLNCAFNTKSCNMTEFGNGNTSTPDFEVIDDPIYGKCFTFNYGKKHKSTRAGPLYGLRLLAVSNQDEYLPLTESAGVRVAVHGFDEEPFPDAFGYNAAAGFTTSFGIKFIKTKRLPAPYGNCTDKRDDSAYYYNGTYQVEGCFRSCFQKAIQEQCNCSDPRFNVKKGEGHWFCPVFGKLRECVDSFNNNNESTGGFNVVQRCQCPQPCTESTYGVTVSTALWPSDVYTPPACQLDKYNNKPWKDPMQTAMDTVIEGESSEDRETRIIKVCTDWYKENTMLIEVYYERMNYQLLSESEAYTMVNLVSDMGGQLGLWMGISVITVIEFISLGILLCLYCCNKPKDDQVEDIDSNQPHAFSDGPGGAAPIALGEMKGGTAYDGTMLDNSAPPMPAAVE